MTCELFVAPVSIEVLDAALRAGVSGLLCSEAQVPPGGGLGYGGIDYALLNAMHGGRKDVIVQRDHLKIDQHDFKALSEILASDRDNGFDAVMLHANDHTEYFHQAKDTAKRMGYKLELGPGEDDSRQVYQGVINDKEAWYISAPMGLYVDDLKNRGKFKSIWQQNGWQPMVADAPVRAHNCDYLPLPMLKQVAQNVKGINLAPQLGSIQSTMYLNIAMVSGRPIDRWQSATLADDKRAERWCKASPHNRVLACGHYHFDKLQWRSQVYEEIVAALTRYLKVLMNVIGTDSKTLGQ